MGHPVIAEQPTLQGRDLVSYPIVSRMYNIGLVNNKEKWDDENLVV